MGSPATVGIAVSEKLGFFQRVDYGIAGQAFSVAAVQGKPDFIGLVGRFEAIRVHGWAFRRWERLGRRVWRCGLSIRTV